VLCTIFQKEADAHLAGSVSQFQIEALTEIASVIKRLAGDETGLQTLVQCNVQETLTQLLNSNGKASQIPVLLAPFAPFASQTLNPS
jgi:hypothetical protein